MIEEDDAERAALLRRLDELDRGLRKDRKLKRPPGPGEIYVSPAIVGFVVGVVVAIIVGGLVAIFG